jgi:hypothetical protein
MVDVATPECAPGGKHSSREEEGGPTDRSFVHMNATNIEGV